MGAFSDDKRRQVQKNECRRNSCIYHLKKLPFSRKPSKNEILSTDCFNQLSPKEMGKLIFHGLDEEGHQVYTIGRGSSKAVIPAMRMAGMTAFDDPLPIVYTWWPSSSRPWKINFPISFGLNWLKQSVLKISFFDGFLLNGSFFRWYIQLLRRHSFFCTCRRLSSEKAPIQQKTVEKRNFKHRLF